MAIKDGLGQERAGERMEISPRKEETGPSLHVPFPSKPFFLDIRMREPATQPETW